MNEPMPKVSDGAALYYVKYQVHVEGALNAEFDAGGVRNDDLALRSGPMRAEALRLRDILRAAGISFPVWPFVEDGT